MTGNNLYTLREAAGQLNISEITLRHWVEKGAPCVVLNAEASKHGKRYRFIPADVIAWAKENLKNNN